MQYFHLEPTVTDAPYLKHGHGRGRDLPSGHSSQPPTRRLRPSSANVPSHGNTPSQRSALPYYVPAAREILLGSPVAVGTAIGFPHGCMSQAAKLAELRECMANGATEVDVALNVLAIKSGRLDVAQRELDELVRCAVGKVSSRPCSSMRSTRRRRSAPFCRCCAARRELCEDPEYAQRPRRPR